MAKDFCIANVLEGFLFEFILRVNYKIFSEISVYYIYIQLF